jgi:hypothetical protein
VIIPDIQRGELMTLTEDVTYFLNGCYLVALDGRAQGQEIEEDGDPDRVLTIIITTPHAQVLSGGVSNTVDDTIVLIGNISSLNEIIASLIYTTNIDFFGSTYLNFTVTIPTLSGSVEIMTSTTIVPVNVNPVADAPSLNISSHHMVIQASKSTQIIFIAVSDPDMILSYGGTFVPKQKLSGEVPISFRHKLIVTLRVTSGVLSAPSLAELSPGEYLPISWQSNNEIVLEGSAPAINKILRFVTFQSQIIIGEGTTEVNFSVTALSSSSRMSVTETIVLRIVPSILSSASAVYVLLPIEPVLMQEDVEYSFGNSLQISLNDDSFPDNVLTEVFIIAERGMLMLQSEEIEDVLTLGREVEILSSGPVLHLKAGGGTSVAAMNKALTQVIFYSPLNYFGSILLTISAIRDPLGTSPSITVSPLLLYVIPVDDPPVITVKTDAAAYVLQTIEITAPTALSLFTVFDVDDNHFMRVTISCERGALSLDTEFGTVYTIINNPVKNENFSSTITFLVDPIDVTLTLDLVIYSPLEAYKGLDKISLVVTSLLPSVDLAYPPDALGRTGGASPSYTDGISVVSSVSIPVAAKGFLKFTCASAVRLLEDDSFVLGSICSMNIEKQIQNAAAIQGQSNWIALTFTVENGLRSLNKEGIEGISNVERECEGAFVVNKGPFGDDEEPWYTIMDEGYVQGVGSGSLSINIAAMDVPEFLSLVVFKPDVDCNGGVTLVLSSSQSFMVTRIGIDVIAVNDHPVLRILDVDHATAFTVNSTSTLPLSFVVVLDVDLFETDNAVITVEIAGTLGTVLLNIDELAGRDVLVIDDGSATGIVHLIATDKALTALFSSGAIVYVPPFSSRQGCKQLNGCNNTQDSITIIADDHGYIGSLDSNQVSPDKPIILTINVTVIHQAVPMSVILSPLVIVGMEDESLFLGDNITLSRGTFNVEDDVQVFLEVSGGISVGTVILGIQLASVTSDTYKGILKLSGQFEDVQEGLKSLYFIPFKDFCMGTNILITLKNLYNLNDNYNAVLSLLITPVNDPPVITSAVSSGIVYNITQGQVLSFSSVQSSIQVIQNETLLFSNTTGVGKYSKKNVMFSISDVDVGSGFSGADWGQVSAHIGVTCGSLLLNPSNQLSLLSSAGNFLQISTYDPVINSEELCVTSSIDISNPTPYIGGASDGSIDFVIGYKGYILKGDLEVINAALSSMSYQSPSAPIHNKVQGQGQGPSNISLYVSDLGNFGIGGIQSVNMTINLCISSEEDAIESLSQDLSILVLPQLTITEGLEYVRFNELIDSSVGWSRNNETVYHLEIRTDSNEKLTIQGDTPFNISVQAVVNIPTTKESRINVTNTSEIDINSSFYSVTLKGKMNDILSILKSACFISLPQYFHGTVTVSFTISRDDSDLRLLSQGVSSTIVIIPHNNPPVLKVFTNLTQHNYTYNNGSISHATFAADSGVPSVLPFSIHDPDILFLQLTDSPICAGGYCNLAVNISCVRCFFASDNLSPLSPTTTGMHI